MAAKKATLEICRYPGNSSLKLKVEIKMIANNIKNGLKTLSCHFEFYTLNAYWKIFPIIIDDRSLRPIRLFPMIDCEISTDSTTTVDSEHFRALFSRLKRN